MSQLEDSCPVCGMSTEIEVPPVTYNKMYFHFCSEQCRETFSAHPVIYSSRTGKARSEILKRRAIHLTTPLDSEVSALLVPYLKEMMGVKMVIVEGDTISITYDLLQVTESQIEKALGEIGLQLGGSWLEHLRRAWVDNSEEIELDNLAAPRYHRTRPQA